MMAIASAPLQIAPSAHLFQSYMNQSAPANLSTAETTPIRAPPAMKPDAISVPFFTLASFTSLSLLLLPTHQEMAPPSRSGKFKSIGMNIPRQNANVGTLQKFSSSAMAAPIP